MSTDKKLGRPPEAGERRSHTIAVRATAAEAQQFEALGGAAWLRKAMAAAYARLLKKEGKTPPA